MNRHRILLVDDDPSLLKLLAIRLQANNFDIEVASNGAKALNKLTSFQPHLIISDLRMKGMNGLDLFKAIHEQFPTLPVIILTAHGTIPDAINATHMGVFSFLTKPFDSDELLKTIVCAISQGYACDDKLIENNNQHWRRKIISQSAVIEELLGQAWRIAQSNVSTLIQSASGTGKELLAQAIHNASPRHNEPFVPVNCAAIPEPLLESALFGHRKGAFTGATRNRIGLFETAHKGTLFLDEIGNMPMEFQVKLLRVLDGKVQPIGTNTIVPVDVRIISATNTDLEAAIEANNFREDLFYRLNVVMLKIPPLCDRREDIPLLAKHFLHQARDRAELSVASSFSPEAMEALMMAPWPGNVRQLLNVVEQVVALSVSPVISAGLIKNALRIKTNTVIPLVKAKIDFERNYLVHILKMTRGNVTQAALLAQRNRTEFYKLLNRHLLEPSFFRHS